MSPEEALIALSREEALVAMEALREGRKYREPGDPRDALAERLNRALYPERYR